MGGRGAAKRCICNTIPLFSLSRCLCTHLSTVEGFDTALDNFLIDNLTNFLLEQIKFLLTLIIVVIVQLLRKLAFDTMYETVLNTLILALMGGREVLQRR